MLDEKDRNHYRGTAAHHQCIKNPEMCVAYGASDPPPQQSNDRCIGNHVDTFSAGIKETRFVIQTNLFWRYPGACAHHFYGAFDGMANEFKEAQK